MLAPPPLAVTLPRLKHSSMKLWASRGMDGLAKLMIMIFWNGVRVTMSLGMSGQRKITRFMAADKQEAGGEHYR